MLKYVSSLGRPGEEQWPEHTNHKLADFATTNSCQPQPQLEIYQQISILEYRSRLLGGKEEGGISGGI